MTGDLRFTEPLYTVARAARLVGMPNSTLRTWAQGYEKTFPDRPVVRQGPVITAVPPRPRGRETIPFIGLTEAMVVQAFRRTNLSMQHIRRAVRVLAEQDELEHALASRQLYTDGARILYDYSRQTDDDALEQLTDVESGQRVFKPVIKDYLKRLVFDHDRWATGLIVPVTKREILRIRPEVASGEPLFVNGGAPLSAVESRHRAGESIRSIARDYGVPAGDIREALDALSPRTRAA